MPYTYQWWCILMFLCVLSACIHYFVLKIGYNARKIIPFNAIFFKFWPIFKAKNFFGMKNEAPKTAYMGDRVYGGEGRVCGGPTLYTLISLITRIWIPYWPLLSRTLFGRPFFSTAVMTNNWATELLYWPLWRIICSQF